MNKEELEESRLYKVLVNHEEQYSIWFAERENPAGWNFMPGHALPMASSVFTDDYASIMDSVGAVCEHVKVLHFGDRKKFPWAIKLRESFLEPDPKNRVRKV